MKGKIVGQTWDKPARRLRRMRLALAVAGVALATVLGTLAAVAHALGRV